MSHTLRLMLSLACVTALHGAPSTLPQRFAHTHDTISRLHAETARLPTAALATPEEAHQQLASCHAALLTLQQVLVEEKLPASVHASLTKFLQFFEQLTPEALATSKRHTIHSLPDDLCDVFGAVMQHIVHDMPQRSETTLHACAPALRALYQTADQLLTPACYERAAWWREAAATVRTKLGRHPGRTMAGITVAGMVLVVIIGVFKYRYSLDADVEELQRDAVAAMYTDAVSYYNHLNTPNPALVPLLGDGSDKSLSPPALSLVTFATETAMPFAMDFADADRLFVELELTWFNYLRSQGHTLPKELLTPDDPRLPNWARVAYNIDAIQRYALSKGRDEPDPNKLPDGRNVNDLVPSIEPPLNPHELYEGRSSVTATPASVARSLPTSPEGRYRDLADGLIKIAPVIVRRVLPAPPGAPDSPKPSLLSRVRALLRMGVA